MDAKSFINQYLSNKKMIQEIILDYLDNENDQDHFSKIESHYENIRGDKEELNEFVRMIHCISKNYHRFPKFFQKIEQIITLFKDDIRLYFSNNEIFNIFKSNVRILFFLFKEKIIIIDNENIEYIKRKYSKYFYPEIKEFESSTQNNEQKKIIKDSKNNYNDFNNINEIDTIVNQSNEIYDSDDSDDFYNSNNFHVYKLYIDRYNNSTNMDTQIKITKDIDIEEFNQKREIGENDNILCQLIRNDQINEFISYVNKNEININHKIKSSDFETNSFLRKHKPTFIEYSAFFGSIQIFKYLIQMKCTLRSSIWLYAIHGFNPEIIHIFEDNQINPPKMSYLDCFYESLKCHHTVFSIYLNENYLLDTEVKNIDIVNLCMKFKNFITISDFFGDSFNNCQFLNQICFINFCMNYDFFKLVRFILMQDEIDLNQQITITKKENANRKIECKESIIHIAYEKEKYELLELILTNPKIDINLKTELIYISIQKEKIYKTNTEEDNNLGKSMLDFSDDDDDDKYDAKEYDEQVHEHEKYFREDTLLNMALKKGDLNLVKLLLANKEINPNSITNICIKGETEINTALCIALEKEYFDIAKLLLSIKSIDARMISINKYGSENTPFSIAVLKNNIDIIKEFVSRKEINVNEEILFTKIIPADDKDSDYETEETVKTILHVAIENNDMEIIKLLLQHPKLNVNILCDEAVSRSYHIYKVTPLFRAVENENIPIIQMLLAHPKINVNKKSILSFKDQQKTALQLAVEKGSIEIVKMLLNVENIIVNEKNPFLLKSEDNKSLLRIAIDNKDFEMVRLLLSRKDINVNEKYEDTTIYGYSEDCIHDDCKCYVKILLHISIEKQCFEITKLLIERKELEINEKSFFSEICINRFKEGMYVKYRYYDEFKTALQLAVEKKDKELVALLLSHPNIDVNSLSERTYTKYNGDEIKEETTALHTAVRNKDEEIIKLLLNHNGIDVNVVDKNGKRPIDLTNDMSIKKLFQ